jgi:glyoxylase-like metal-dependent hydrolase (beta-lactamase superfamily II)
MKIVSCLGILILLGLGTGAAAADSSSSTLAPLKAEKVADNVWFFRGVSGQASADNQGYTSNAGFVVTATGVLVFDALGTPALAQAMLKSIAGITRQPVRRVIVSHYHADHVYGLQVFKAAGAQIWARREGQIYLDSDLAQERLTERRTTLAPWVDQHTRLLPADRWLDLVAGQTLDFRMGGTRFRLISAGHAHAPDDLMLLVVKPRVLFAGDLYFNGRLPFVVDGNTRGWLADIDAMQALDARCIVPGHGTMSCEVGDDLRMTADYLRFLRAQMGAAVEQLTQFDEAYAAIDWSRFAPLPTFDAANRRNAFSVYLEMQTEILGAAAQPPH